VLQSCYIYDNRVYNRVFPVFSSVDQVKDMRTGIAILKKMGVHSVNARDVRDWEAFNKAQEEGQVFQNNKKNLK